MHLVESFMQLPFTRKRFYTMRVDRTYLGRDREITWLLQETLSALHETLFP